MLNQHIENLHAKLKGINNNISPIENLIIDFFKKRISQFKFDSIIGIDTRYGGKEHIIDVDLYGQCKDCTDEAYIGSVTFTIYIPIDYPSFSEVRIMEVKSYNMSEGNKPKIVDSIKASIEESLLELTWMLSTLYNALEQKKIVKSQLNIAKKFYEVSSDYSKFLDKLVK